MTCVRDFHLCDFFTSGFNAINLDPLTETYSMSFYLLYTSRWPEYFRCARDPNGEMMGYFIGKAEGSEAKSEWHGHVSAVTISTVFRRLGLASLLMKDLESISNTVHNAFFVDLFVRASNLAAISMYEKLGYSIFRTVIGYYKGLKISEDACEMRKPLIRDKKQLSLKCKKRRIKPSELEWNTI